MMTFLLLAAAMSGAFIMERNEAAPAQLNRQEPPDSTYLKLVLDLGTAGTFSYDIVSQRRQINIHQTYREVNIKVCQLAFEVHAEHIARGTQAGLTNFYDSLIGIPMDEIDVKKLSIRVLHSPYSDARLEPAPWMLRVALKPGTDARIVLEDMRNNRKRNFRNLELTLPDYETATQVKGWLADGAQRCKTWETGPLEPIR